MSERIGVCADCGGRFKIPPDYIRESAKCRKCGGTIEIPRGPPSEETVEPIAPVVEAGAHVDEPGAPDMESDAAVGEAGAPDPEADESAVEPAAPEFETSTAVVEPSEELAESAVADLALEEPCPEPAEPISPEAEPPPMPSSLDLAPIAPTRRGRRLRAWGAAAGVILGLSGAFYWFVPKGDDEPRDSAPEESPSTTASLAPVIREKKPEPTPAPAPEVVPMPAPAPSARESESPAPRTAPPAPDPAPPAPEPAPPAPPPPPEPEPGKKEPSPEPPKPPPPPAPTAPAISARFVFEPLPRAPGTSDEEWSVMERIAAELHDGASERRLALAGLRIFGIKAVPVAVNSLQGLDLAIAEKWAEADEIARFIQDDLTAQTILIPYRSEYSTDPKEVARNGKVLKSIVDYWNLQVNHPERWKALLETYEEKRTRR